MNTGAALQVLFLVLVANAAPIVVRRLLRDRCRWPLDGGLRLPDGHRLFGRSKTLRGVFAGVGAAALAGPLFGIAIAAGALVGLGAMLGDLLSSVAKRRLGWPSGARAPVLDQVPEALVPALLARPVFSLGWVDVAAVVVAFAVLEVGLSRLSYRLEIRRRPW